MDLAEALTYAPPDEVERLFVTLKLAAEVESLRAENGKLRVLVEREYHCGYDAGAGETQDEVESLRAAVERVRAACAWPGYLAIDAYDVLRALDGHKD